MGKITKTITTYTCDLCGCEMDNLGESTIEIIVKNNDANVGPSIIIGSLRFLEPYCSSSEGIICKSCKKEWLANYVKTL